MKVTKELVDARIERSDQNSDFTVSRDDFFAIEVIGFKFLRCCVEVFDDQANFLIGGNFQ